MKLLLSSILAGIMLGVALRAIADSPGQSPKGVQVMSVTSPTGGIAATTSTIGPLNGYIDGIYITVAGTASTTCTATIATSASYGPFAVARTLYSNTTLDSSDNGYVPLRQQAKDYQASALSGVYVPYFLMGDYVTLTATNCTSTGQTIRATIVLSP